MAHFCKTMLALSLILCLAANLRARQPAYLDPAEPLRQRVDDLLQRMTLEEKIGQMNMPCSYLRVFGMSHEDRLEFARKFAEGTAEKGLGPGGGFFTLANHVLDGGTSRQVEFFNTLQEIATQKTRLKIPLLQTEEGTHGLMCADATIFPEGLAIGSTWNLDLVEQIYEIAAREGRAAGMCTSGTTCPQLRSSRIWQTPRVRHQVRCRAGHRRRESSDPVGD